MSDLASSLRSRLSEPFAGADDGDTPVERFRAQVVLSMGVFLIVCIPSAAGWEFLFGSFLMGLLMSSVVLPMMVLTIWLRRGGEVNTIGLALLAVFYLLLASANLLSAGTAPGVNIAFPVFALFAAIISSTRWVLVWFVLILVSIAGAAWMRAAGVDPWLVPSPRSTQSAIDRIPALLSAGALGLGMLVSLAMQKFRGELASVRQLEVDARREANASAERFAEFADIAADGFWETNAELRFTYCSPGLERTLGIEPGEALGKVAGNAFAERLADTGELALQREHLQNKRPFRDLPVRVRSESGEDRWLMSEGNPRFDVDGGFLGFRGVVHDISERIASEESLRASERRLRTIADNLPVLISYVDAQGVFRFNNLTYASWLGKPLSEITDQHLSAVYTPDTYAAIEPHLRRALGGEIVRFELPANEHRTRDASATYVPERDADGNVVGAYGLVHDVSDIKRVEDELRQLSQIDALTGLANRRRFNQCEADAIARSDRSGLPMALMVVDIDHFKAINDTLGHEAGDQALQQFAALLQRCVRQNDTVARLAGDEFMIILEQMQSVDAAAVVAEKVLATLAESPFQLTGHVRKIQASIGIACREPDGESGQVLFRRADIALYAAKEGGRSTYRVAGTSDTPTSG